MTYRACPFCEVDWGGEVAYGPVSWNCWLCGRKGAPGSIDSWFRLPKAMRISYLKLLAGDRG